MRIIRYLKENRPTLGICSGTEVIDLSAVIPNAPGDLADLLKLSPTILDEVAAALAALPDVPTSALAGVKLLPPIARPGKIICLGVNYLDHAQESDLQKPDHLVVFFRAGTSLIGHEAPMIRPNCSDQLDYEGELAVFIGRQGRNLTIDDALSVVAGYSAFNDGSIRDVQIRVSQWTLGKNFDDTGAVGPEFVSADELPVGASGLRLQTRLNGNVMQDANTRDLMFDVKETISLLSECMTLEPGDMIITGTPGGVGLARTPPIFMKPGDICEIEIEKIGVLRNVIVQQAVSKVLEAVA